MLLDLNALADELIEEALLKGTITLSSGVCYSLSSQQIVRLLALVKQGKPVKTAFVRNSVLPEEDLDFNMNDLLYGKQDSDNDK